MRKLSFLQSLLEQESPKNKSLYRVISNKWNKLSVGDVVTLLVRKDRRPLDSTTFFSFLFNLGIYANLGIDHIRKSAMFVGNDYKSLANVYGYEYRGDQWAIVEISDDYTIVFDPMLSDTYPDNIPANHSLGNIVQRVLNLMYELEDVKHPSVSKLGMYWEQVAESIEFRIDRHYASNTPSTELLRNALTGIIADNHVEDALTKIIEVCKEATSGYQKGSINSLPSSKCEAMIVNVDKVNATVIATDLTYNG